MALETDMNRFAYFREAKKRRFASWPQIAESTIAEQAVASWLEQAFASQGPNYFPVLK